MQLSLRTRSIYRDKFDDARCVVGLAALGAHDGELQPLGSLQGVANLLAAIDGAVQGVLGGQEVIHIAGAVGGVARSHEGFGGGGEGLSS